jgi:hypothetical protein
MAETTTLTVEDVHVTPLTSAEGVEFNCSDINPCDPAQTCCNCNPTDPCY